MSYALQTTPAWQAPSLPPFLHDLLTFRGRMNRARYWRAVLTVLCISVAVAIFAGLLRAIGNVPMAAVAVFWGVLLIAFAVPCYFIAIKRLHDRNKSGHWLWLFCLAPGALNLMGKMAVAQGATPVGMALMLAGIGVSIWGFLEIACLRGTTGPNRFGPDPLQGQAA
jgi:uncharacterized membrane protein YhaH (DUF805 family)